MRPAAPITAIRRINRSLQIAEEPLYTLEPATGLGRMGAIALPRRPELFHQLALTTAQMHRGFDGNTAHQIARTAATNRRNTLATQTELLARLSTFRNSQFHPTIKSRHFQLATQRR